MYNFLYLSDLTEAIQQSFSPEPDVVVLDSVVDAKEWMEEVVPALHDHLKAHQFKFERNKVGECRMFYKEWSTDTFWLPETGLALLLSTTGMYTHAVSCENMFLNIPYSENVFPEKTPKIFGPSFDQDIVNKVETTLKKLGAYLHRAGAASWWQAWFRMAQKNIGSSEPKEIEGDTSTIYVHVTKNIHGI